MLASCSGPPWISPRRGQVVLCPAAFCSLFLGTFAAIEGEVNPATTPRDTLTIYCNTALCVKAQLNHTEAKPPWAAAPTDKFPCWQGSPSVLPSAGGCSSCPLSPQVGALGPPPHAPSKIHSTAAAQRSWNCCSGSAVGTERRDLDVTRF